MKLIIDIPDNQYNQICELRLHNRTIYDDAIRNGIPLEKIRDEIDSYCSDNRDRNDGLYIAMKIIDKYRKEQE